MLTRILFLLITLFFLAGQVQYDYAHCEMMKRPADAAMLMNCAALHHSVTSGAKLIPSNRMLHLRIISKYSTDSFEYNSVISPTHGPAVDANFARVALQVSFDTPAEFIDFSQSHPDIILSTRSLRI